MSYPLLSAMEVLTGAALGLAVARVCVSPFVSLSGCEEELTKARQFAGSIGMVGGALSAGTHTSPLDSCIAAVFTGLSVALFLGLSYVLRRIPDGYSHLLGSCDRKSVQLTALLADGTAKEAVVSALQTHLDTARSYIKNRLPGADEVMPESLTIQVDTPYAVTEEACPVPAAEPPSVSVTEVDGAVEQAATIAQVRPSKPVKRRQGITG